MWKISVLRCVAAQCARATGSLVSLRYAPSFKQPPAEEVIAKPVKEIPADWVTAYVIPEVISEKQEDALLEFVEPWFARLPFNDGHLDGLIHHYKEFYRSYNALMKATTGANSVNTSDVRNVQEEQSAEKHEKEDEQDRNMKHNKNQIEESKAHSEKEACQQISDTSAELRSGISHEHTELESEEDALFDEHVAFSSETNQLVRSALTHVRGLATHYLPHIPIDDRVHFLRLSGSGFIRSHVDETRNSSGIIGGLCLRSGRVMTLTHPRFPEEKVELLLAPRCFYAIIGSARYTWEHSVDWVKDDDEHIKRIQGSLVVEGTPVHFDGQETPYKRFDRTVIIFRGVSPMHLFARRVLQPQNIAPFSTKSNSTELPEQEQEEKKQ